MHLQSSEKECELIKIMGSKIIHLKHILYNKNNYVRDHKLPRNPFDLASNLQSKCLVVQLLMILHVQFFFGRSEYQVNLNYIAIYLLNLVYILQFQSSYFLT